MRTTHQATAQAGALQGRATRQPGRRAVSCRVAELSPAVPRTAPERPALEPRPKRNADLGTPISQPELRRYLDCYKSSPVERTYEVPPEAITGTIPADLEGTLLRNGPGNFDYGEQRICHPFDGDGLVLSFAFRDGKVLARRKFVRTQALVTEMTQKKILYKGAFQVGDPSGKWSLPFNLSIRQPANTGVVRWASRLLALFERDLPYQLDDALRTQGPSTLSVLDEADCVAAHYRVVAEPDGARRFVGLSALERGLDKDLKFFELDAAGNKVAETVYRCPDAAFAFFHDYLVTDNYYIVLDNPTRMDFRKLLLEYTTGKACIAECIYLDPTRRMKIHCIPRPGKAGAVRQVHTADPKFCFHHINAYETGTGEVVIDTLGANFISFDMDLASMTTHRYQDPENSTTIRRLVARPDAAAVTEHDLRVVPGMSGVCEFAAQLPPALTGRPHHVTFCAGSRTTPDGGMLQKLLRIEMEPSNGVTGPLRPDDVTVRSYYPGDRRYCGEPVFVPRAGGAEGEGYIFTVIQDLSHPEEDRSQLEILDAADLESGPLATIALPDYVPPGLHGSWTSEYVGRGEDEAVPYSNDIRVQL